MQPRSLEQILTELGSTYDPQVSSLRQQQTLIPQQIADQENQLKAQEQDYYNNTIMGDARRRGLGFAGIPIGERARYGATQFLPALANLRAQGRQQTMSLEDAILGVQEKRNTMAQNLFQNDQQLAENRRQFDTNLAFQREQLAAQQRAAAANNGSALASYFAGANKATAAPAQQKSVGSMVAKQGGGFAFTGANNQPVSAGTYAQSNNIPVGNLLMNMAQNGDQYAAQAYQWIQNQLQMPYAQSNPDQVIKNATAKFAPLFWGVQ